MNEYILDIVSDKDYFILLNGSSNSIKYSKKANTLDGIIYFLKCSGIKDLKIIDKINNNLIK